MHPLAVVLSSLAFAERCHTAEEDPEVCPTLHSKDDKALREQAVTDVGKRKPGVSEEVVLSLEKH